MCASLSVFVHQESVEIKQLEAEADTWRAASYQPRPSEKARAILGGTRFLVISPGERSPEHCHSSILCQLQRPSSALFSILRFSTLSHLSCIVCITNPATRFSQRHRLPPSLILCDLDRRRFCLWPLLEPRLACSSSCRSLPPPSHPSHSSTLSNHGRRAPQKAGHRR